MEHLLALIERGDERGLSLSVEAGPKLNLTSSDVDSLSYAESFGLRLNFGDGGIFCIVVACSIVEYGFVGPDSHWYDHPGYSTM